MGGTAIEVTTGWVVVATSGASAASCRRNISSMARAPTRAIVIQRRSPGPA